MYGGLRVAAEPHARFRFRVSPAIRAKTGPRIANFWLAKAHKKRQPLLRGWLTIMTIERRVHESQS
jgi:hypothetical protein